MILPRVSIVGSGSLLGRDLEEVFQQGAPDLEIKLIGTGLETAILTERGGEPVILHSLEEAIIDKSKVVVLGGSAADAKRTFERVSGLPNPPAVIDLTYTLEKHPCAVLTAPLSEPPDAGLLEGGVYVLAHPAAAAMAGFLRRLHEHNPLQRAVVQVFEPASERGKAGIDELQEQTVDLLSFRAVPKVVFDEQLSFNMLARYGADAPVSLASIEDRILRHLATLLGRGKPVPMPSLRLIQAPVFHSYCFSVWAEFKKKPAVKLLRKALASDHIDVCADSDESPTNSGVASRSGMTVGNIAVDRNNANAAWFWIAADNYRTRSEDALCLTRLLAGGAAQA